MTVLFHFLVLTNILLGFNFYQIPQSQSIPGHLISSKSVEKIDLPQTSKLKKNYSSTPYAIYSTLKDRKGNRWFGTESSGVCKYHGKTFTWLDTPELGLAIRAIYEDKKGNIWIGNNGFGLFKYDGKQLTNFTQKFHLGNPDFQNNLKGKLGTMARVWSISEDKYGSLCIATIDAGLWKFTGKGFLNYTTKDGLLSNTITKLSTEKNGNLRIETDKGVNFFDGESILR